MAINQYYVVRRRANKNDKRDKFLRQALSSGLHRYLCTHWHRHPKADTSGIESSYFLSKLRWPREDKAEYSLRTQYKLLFLYNMIKETSNFHSKGGNPPLKLTHREKGSWSNLGAAPLIHPRQAEGLSQPCWTHKTTKLITSSNTILTREGKIVRQNQKQWEQKH